MAVNKKHKKIITIICNDCGFEYESSEYDICPVCEERHKIANDDVFEDNYEDDDDNVIFNTIL